MTKQMSPSTGRLVTLLFVFLLGFPVFSGAAGHDEPEFKSCLAECIATVCPKKFPLPLSQRLLFWSCEDNCKYECMHEIVDKRIKAKQKVKQYYGKWPFYRLLGMQEPASVFFSCLNFWAHYKGYKLIKHAVSKNYPYKRLALNIGLSGMNAWIWSAVFHSRDKPLTEKLDYFSAMIYILTVSFHAYVRMFRLEKSRVRHVLGAVYSLFFVGHVSYLTFFKFDYVYNMAAGVVIGLVTYLSWCVWAAFQFRSRKYVYKIVLDFLLILGAVSFELFDFAPFWGVFDVHSLWHLSTVPVTFLLYDFFKDDADYEAKLKKKK